MNPTLVPSWDAHNHLQAIHPVDLRSDCLAAARRAGVEGMVVNGTCETDWPEVAELARSSSAVVPSFGYHPWRVSHRTPGWLDALRRFLVEFPHAGVGEMGIDAWILEQPSESLRRWGGRLGEISPLPLADQEEVFLQQLNLAVTLNRPVSIHCIQAWGRLLELLRGHVLPARGFLLHSYGGSRELVAPFAELGAYFGFSGALAQDRKQRQREAFRSVPLDRLLLETDAPDQPLPEALREHALPSTTDGRDQNHPANLPAVQRYAAAFLGHDLPAFSAQMGANHHRLFGHNTHI
jgi:TatD DNase family protein